MEIKIFGLNISVTKQKPLSDNKQNTSRKITPDNNKDSLDNTLKAQEIQGRAQVLSSNKALGTNTDLDIEDDFSDFEDISEFDKEDFYYFANILETNEEIDEEEIIDRQEAQLEKFKSLLYKYKDNKSATAQIEDMLIRHELLFRSTALNRHLDKIQFPREYTYLENIKEMNTHTDKYLSDTEKIVFSRVILERKFFNSLNNSEEEND